MLLLQTQLRDLYLAIDGSRFQRSDFAYEVVGDDDPIIRFAEDPFAMWFLVQGSKTYGLTIRPGHRRVEEYVEVDHWNDVVVVFQQWLDVITRELSAAERNESPGNAAPGWALEELPATYREAVAEIARLQEVERTFRRLSGLLWATGEPLHDAVRDAIRDIGFPAENTEPGATYDLTVTLPTGRLLIEVTGIEGSIAKRSNKIAQILQAGRMVASDSDRVVLGLNAHRQRPLGERESLELVTKDALTLLVGLNAVIFRTSDLFGLWMLSRTHQDRARSIFESLYTATAGIVRLVG